MFGPIAGSETVAAAVSGGVKVLARLCFRLTAGMTFNYESVRDLLRCPKSRAVLVYTGEALVSCDPATRLRYPVTEGLPVLLIDEATELTHADWAALMAANARDPQSGAPAPQEG